MKSQIHFRKQFLLLFSLLFLGITAFAQEGRKVEADTTTIILKNKRIIIIADEDGKRVEVKEIKSDNEFEGEEVIIIRESDEGEERSEREEEYEYDDDEYDEESEYDYDDNDDYDYEHKKKKRGKSSDVDLLAFDLGLTNYYSNGVLGNAAIPGSPLLALNELRPGSHVALHFVPTTASLIGRGVVNLKTAITLDWTNLYFANNVVLEDQGDVLNLSTSNVPLTRNKLTARYIQMPLLLNINTDPGGDDGLSISFGVYGGVLWKAKTKQVHEINGQKVVDKVAGDYQLNPIKYGLMGRLDFKWFDIYAMYSLTNLFVDNQIPETQTIVAGINIINF